MKTSNFIKKAENKHNNKYNYSLVEYETSHEKIKILCPLHGIFEQSPTNHLSGNGCPKCVGRNKTNDNFIEECKSIHGEKYDYSKIIYVNNKTKVDIICPIHGLFKQAPSNHLNGNCCPKCRGKNKTNNEFIIIANLKHNNKYDYSLIKNTKNINIICPHHGIFNQRASHHLSGSGCPKCVGKNKTNNEFIHNSTKIHGDKYDYSLVEYVNSKTKVDIICPLHGNFKQRPYNHEKGQGCPKCKESKGEREIREYLEKNKIKYKPQKRFSDCKDKRPLPFDFYLIDYNICIEYNGRQHYEPVDIFGGVNEFHKTQKRDKIKMEYCKNTNTPLIIIKYDENVVNKINNYYLLAPSSPQNCV
jgi:hypothetical protein